jgi:L-ascorbate metabolism protein UlaG (beta-lactamase superfamily)
MKIQLIRHASLWLHYHQVNFLVDPMFSELGANPPVIHTPNPRANPLVSLPSAVQEWSLPDAVLVTHLHPDHWDDAAAAVLPQSIPLLCQPSDAAALLSSGFIKSIAIDHEYTYEGVTISRTSGQHGKGEIGKRMGNVSGYVLKADNQPTLYIAGDTIWCDDVKEALDLHRPDVTIVNAGGARFLEGDPITMDADDVVSLCRYAPYTKVIAVHMEAINHCLVTRADLQRRLAAEGLLDQVVIPGDGDWI